MYFLQHIMAFIQGIQWTFWCVDNNCYCYNWNLKVLHSLKRSIP